MRYLTTIVLILLLFSFNPARAEMALSLISVATQNIPEPTLNTGGMAFTGGGTTLEIKMASILGIELGLFYLPYVLNGYTNDNLEATFAFRIWLGRLLTFSFGGYGTNQVSNLPRQINNLAYGARSTAGLNIGISKSTSFFLEGGGQYQLSNSSLTTGRFSQNQLLALLGLRFHMGGHSRSGKSGKSKK